MYRRHWMRRLCLTCALLMFSVYCGCTAPDSNGPDTAGTKAASSESGAGTRPNTPTVYEPEAPQTEVLGTDTLAVDISNTDQGYIMVRYSGGSDKVNIQITGPDDVSYKYFLGPDSSFTALPLTCGSGTYSVSGYEHVADNKYAVLFHETTEVRLANDLLPFLYPSQYVNFNKDSQAVSTASETVSDASSDLDAISDIYHYVITHVTYDEEKAANVPSGYLPDVDETLQTGTGICFDYASLTCAMLRSQAIPSRLEIGYAGDVYHAWISVYTEETGWIDRLIEFTENGWTRMDPTFASSNDNSETVLKYIGDGTHYQTLYIR